MFFIMFPDLKISKQEPGAGKIFNSQPLELLPEQNEPDY